MSNETEKPASHSVRIWMEPPQSLSGPMGTAMLVRVPSYRIQRDNWGKSVFCTVSRLRKKLAACGMSEAAIEEAVGLAQQLQAPGDSVEIEIE